MKKIALFNHKGGVGKTTLTVNIAAAITKLGKRVLVADADPQCNITSFYMDEPEFEGLLAASDERGAATTLWSAVKPVVEGRGDIISVPSRVSNGVHYLPGDVLLSDYEEELPSAWTECFARRQRGYAVTTALSRVVSAAGLAAQADVCFYDVGPNVGALNRAILMDCDYFITPVAADLFSLRALATVGRSVTKWINDWDTVRGLASDADRLELLKGKPKYAGYITSAYKVRQGRAAANPHADWERRIAPRVRDTIVAELRPNHPDLLPAGGSNKVGGVKHFQSVAADAQKFGLPIGMLRGHINTGHNKTIEEAAAVFNTLGVEIIRRCQL